MPRLDHAAFETTDPEGVAAFYERVFGARVVKVEGHPVMAYVGNSWTSATAHACSRRSI
jgi:catechol 2,3-dioxygenase-like lactoylglutathione lyase family enzyme